MNKEQLEKSLTEALEKGFVPPEIKKFQASGPLRIVDKEGEEDRITVMYRTVERAGRMHNHIFVYTLQEVTDMLRELLKT